MNGVTEKREQHYIPKFYLRNFSLESKGKQIGLYNIQNKLFIGRSSLRKQASQPFYYGKDGLIEDWLGTIENDTAPIIAEILNTGSLPQYNSSDHKKLVAFTVLTEIRNPISSESIINSNRELNKRLNEIHPDVEIPMTTTDDAIQMSLSFLHRGALFSMDLHFKLLINKSPEPFLISDNPVVKYNQFMESRNSVLGKPGYAVKGLQLFLPLSPQVILFFYDPWAYKIGDRKKQTIEITSTEDVFQLNLLQAVNCSNQFFFNEKMTEHYIKKISLYSDHFHKSYQIESRVIETSKHFMILGSKSAKIRLNIPNITLTKKSKEYVFDNRAVHVRPTCEQLIRAGVDRI